MISDVRFRSMSASERSEARELARRELARDEARVIGRVLPARLGAFPERLPLDSWWRAAGEKSGPNIRIFAAMRPRFCSRLD
jgi:hypothetical protein